jgi:hypothetical protein
MSRKSAPLFAAAVILPAAASLFALQSGCTGKAGQAGSGEIYKRDQVLPATLPYENGVVVLEGEPYPVVLTSETVDDQFTLHLQLFESEFEREIYEDTDAQFAFIGSSGEIYDPPIPLLRYPQRESDNWTWAGQMKIGTIPMEASATVVLRPDNPNLKEGSHNTMMATVTLSFEEAPDNTAKREIIFWIQPQKGVIQREIKLATGAYMTRKPQSEDPADEQPSP